jgi:hypothetical protein
VLLIFNLMLQNLFYAARFYLYVYISFVGMIWHPMIVRWCLYLKQKSTAAYDAFRDSEFIRLTESYLTIRITQGLTMDFYPM